MLMGSSAEAGVVFVIAAGAALAASFVLISRLERLAGTWGLSEAMLGLVVALAADAPEITSAVTASIRGQAVIGSGVVLGSNVFNLAALLGLGAIVAGRIRFHRSVVILDGASAIWVAVLAVAVLSKVLSAGEGLALVAVVIGPLLVVAASPERGLCMLHLPSRVASWLGRSVAEEEGDLTPAIHSRRRGRWDVAVGAVSVAVVVGASAVTERSAATLGDRFDLSPLVVGGVVLAAVTSLPNAVGAVYLASRGRGAAVLSEAVNSNMLNVTVGLLVPGMFVGLGAAGEQGLLVASWYAAATVLSVALAFVGSGLSRFSGAAIVLGYLGFVVVAAMR